MAISITEGGIQADGNTTTSVNSAATTNAANAKSDAGVIYSIQANNAAAAARYVRFYDKATAPVPGTDTPIVVITLPAGSSKEINLGLSGKRFSTGISYAITAGATVLDATVTAAGDVQLSFDWL